MGCSWGSNPLPLEASALHRQPLNSVETIHWEFSHVPQSHQASPYQDKPSGGTRGLSTLPWPYHHMKCFVLTAAGRLPGDEATWLLSGQSSERHLHPGVLSLSNTYWARDPWPGILGGSTSWSSLICYSFHSNRPAPCSFALFPQECMSRR